MLEKLKTTKGKIGHMLGKTAKGTVVGGVGGAAARTAHAGYKFGKFAKETKKEYEDLIKRYGK